MIVQYNNGCYLINRIPLFKKNINLYNGRLTIYNLYYVY